MKFDKNSLLLYAVTDKTWAQSSSELFDQVRATLESGTTFLQYREKDFPFERMVDVAKQIKKICHTYNIPFVINDDVDVAMAIDADGIHVGQNDMEAANVRSLVGNGKILGVSVQTTAQAISAEQKGADYLGVGAVFPTGSKDDADEVSFETLKDICQAVNIPVVAIGGISQQNALSLTGSGIDGIAVISAIFAQNDIATATANLLKTAKKIVERKQI